MVLWVSARMDDSAHKRDVCVCCHQPTNNSSNALWTLQIIAALLSNHLKYTQVGPKENRQFSFNDEVRYRWQVGGQYAHNQRTTNTKPVPEPKEKKKKNKEMCTFHTHIALVRCWFFAQGSLLVSHHNGTQKICDFMPKCARCSIRI